MVPSFQEAPRCTVCNTPFSTFKRRHHCRCCGKSLCNEHSSNQMALPQFGIKSAVRVCDDCFHASKQIVNVTEASDGAVIDVSEPSDLLRTLDLSTGDDVSLVEEMPSVSCAERQSSHECTCGMPLCICLTPNSAAEFCISGGNLGLKLKLASRFQQQIISNVQVPKPIASKKTRLVSSGTNSTYRRPINVSYSNELPSLFFSSAKAVNGGSQTVARKYDCTAEGIREAIKSGDTKAVKDLLSNGVDPNYQDKQGMSLLHLAALFNFTEIVFLLIDWGAKADSKNSQGETPLDCAPATLQYKMQQKLKSRMIDA